MKILTLISLLISLPFQLSIVRYNYSYYGDVIHSAPGMHFSTYFNQQTLELQNFNSPEDLVVYNNEIYIIASGSNNLIVVNEDFQIKSEVIQETVTKLVDKTDPITGEVILDPETNEPVQEEVTVVEDKVFRYIFTEFKLSADYEALQIELGLPTVPLTLNKPKGIDVKDTGIYIADTENKRVIKLNHDFEVVGVFSEIDNITFQEGNVVFKPEKITTDTSGRMYITASGVFEGIIELDTDGSFNRFTGVNPIKLTPWEVFTRSIMSEAQLQKLDKFLPTTYTNVTMDSKNFIYATAKPTKNNSESMIQLINPKGVDVLKRNGPFAPQGDLDYPINMNNYVIEGPSSLSDIADYKHGIYTVLDQARSRLFTYDSEGNLLYVNGDEGNQSDKFVEGVALSYFGDKLLVLDRRLKTVVVYEHTEFGQKVNQAIGLHDNGQFEDAAAIWEEVLVLNTNYEVAYKGIGKYYLRQHDYETAMEYFKYGHDQFYYSKAFKAYRNNIIKQNFGWIFAVAIIVPTGIVIYKKIKNRKETEIS